MRFERTLTRRRLGHATRSRTRTRPRQLRVPPARLRILLAAVLGLVLLLGGGWLWLRDSSLVAVEHVSVTGESGPDAGAIRTALVASAHSMTTLDVQAGRLRTAVSSFPEVEGLRVFTQFPHGMRIHVLEQLPVAVVAIAGRDIAVGADGRLLRAVAPGTSLPLIPLAVPPGGPWLTEQPARSAVTLLAAAPYRLLAKVSQVTTVSGRGLVAQLRAGPSIYFGAPTELREKWLAAADVLADPGSVGAAYIDVTDPTRPAAGAGESSSASATGAPAGESAAASAAPSSAPVSTANAG